MDDTLNKMISHRGFKVVSTTAKEDGYFMGFTVWNDAVISALEVNGIAADLGDYGLTGVTIPQGALIFFAEYETVTSITLDSGIIYLLKNKS